MKAGNVDITFVRLGLLIRNAKAARNFLARYKNADDFGALEDEEKVVHMTTLEGMAVEVKGAYDSCEEAFTADEVIEE